MRGGRGWCGRSRQSRAWGSRSPRWPADEILANLARYCTRINETINDSGHQSGVRNPPRPPCKWR
ncbi:MAG: hypothetical protein DCC47_07645 [Acidobacteria bacterium]|nr:MAG: hypothetical protein DCC47_07645 [Acidobacteriota bacterium]